MIASGTLGMIIEFIGTPGAGKTSLLPVVVEFLRQRGTDARTIIEAARPYAERTRIGAAVKRIAPHKLRRPLLWQVFYRLSLIYRVRFVLGHVKLMLHVVRGQARRPATSDLRLHVLRSFFRFVGYYECLRTHARPNDALIVDQGFVHRALELHASDSGELDPMQVRRYIDLLPEPDLLIYVRAPREVCEKRVRNRGIWKHFRHNGPDELARFIANCDLAASMAVRHLREKGWKVIEIRNIHDDLVVTKRELWSLLARVPALTTQSPHCEHLAYASENP